MIYKKDMRIQYFSSDYWFTLKSRAPTLSGFSNMTSGMPLGSTLWQFALRWLVLVLYTYESASFWSQGIASQRKTSLSWCSVSFNVSVDIDICTYLQHWQCHTIAPWPLHSEDVRSQEPKFDGITTIFVPVWCLSDQTSNCVEWCRRVLDWGHGECACVHMPHCNSPYLGRFGWCRAHLLIH